MQPLKSGQLLRKLRNVIVSSLRIMLTMLTSVSRVMEGGAKKGVGPNVVHVLKCPPLKPFNVVLNMWNSPVCEKGQLLVLLPP